MPLLFSFCLTVAVETPVNYGKHRIKKSNRKLNGKLISVLLLFYLQNKLNMCIGR